MKTVFVRTLSVFLLLSNIIGLSNFTNKFNDDLIIEHSHSRVLFLIELLRMIILLMITYAVLKLPSFYLRYFQLIKFWMTIFVARLLKKQIIKYG